MTLLQLMLHLEGECLVELVNVFYGALYHFNLREGSGCSCFKNYQILAFHNLPF